MKKTILPLLLALSCFSAYAWESRPTTEFTLGQTRDSLFALQDRNGNGTWLRSGNALQFSAGVTFDLDSARRFESQLTGGYLYQPLQGVEGEGYLERFPLDSLFFFKHSDHRLGGGLTYHFNPRLSSGSLLNNAGLSQFDDALGYVLQYDYRVLGTTSLGVRYTRMDYTSRATGESLDAGSFGLYFNSRF